jgi:Ca2+-binding EF-hand superfamily protein
MPTRYKNDPSTFTSVRCIGGERYVFLAGAHSLYVANTQVGKAFVQLGFEFTAEFVNDLIKEFDYSEDGLIQLDEFIDMIEATLIVQVCTSRISACFPRHH